MSLADVRGPVSDYGNRGDGGLELGTESDNA